MGTILVILALILLNAVLVSAELAVLSSRKIRLSQAAEKGSRGAAKALALAEDPTRFLSTVQVGITLIAILLGAFGEASIAGDLEARIKTVAVLEDYAHPIALAIVVVSITVVSIVVGELIPKRLAIAFPERIASFTARPLWLVAKVGSPVVSLLSGSTSIILRLFGLKETGGRDDLSEEELRALLKAGTRTGVIHAQEHELLDRVFRLGDLRVKSLMVPRADVHFIDVDATKNQVKIAVATSPHSHFPVCQGSLDKLVGVVHVKDLVKHGMIAGEDVNLSEIAQSPLFVPEAMPALTLLDRFAETRRHIAFVVDEFGGVEGLVTLNDIVERIIGSVVTADDDDPAQITPRADGTVLVDGLLPLQDLFHYFDIDPGEDHDFDDISTAAGFVVALLGRVPRTGDSLDRFGHRFEVVDMDRRRIDKLLVTALKPADEQEQTE